MIKTDKHIEIVSSTTRGLSSMAKESRRATLAVLSQHYRRVGITIVNNISDLQALVELKPDLVFLGMKFVLEDESLGLENSPKVWVTDYLDNYGIAYTGSSQAAHELELNKHLAKQRAVDCGLDTSPFHIIKQGQTFSAQDIDLKYPLFVKPANKGGGTGIDNDSMVYNLESLRAKITSIATNLQSDSLVEEYLPGREFSVAILKSEFSSQLSVMPLELIAPPNAQGARFLSADVKKADSEQFMKVTDIIINSKIKVLALDVFQALGGRDYGRIDVRLDEYGTPHFLEANLIPSLLNGYGNFPKACALNIGMDYENMILHIIRLGLARVTSVYDEPEEPALIGLLLPAAAPDPI